MGAPLFLPRREATQQPQGGPLQINRANPLARGLVFAWIPANDLLLKNGAPTRRVGPSGVGLTTDGGTAYAYSNAAPAFTFNECSVTAILTPSNIDSATTYAVACGNSTNTIPLFLLGQGGTSQQLSFRIRDAEDFDSVAAASSAAWANGITTVATGTRSGQGQFLRIYANGAQLAQTTVNSSVPTAFDRFAIGGLLRSTFAQAWQGTTSLVLIHSRALSPQEVASLAANPWQVFQAPQRTMPILAAASGGITADLAKTLGAATAGATATAAVAASATPTLGAVTASSSASVAINAALAKTLGAATVSSSGTLATSASLAATLGAAQLVSTGALALAATATNTLGPAQLTSAATVAITAAASRTLGSATTAATASVSLNAALGKTLQALTLAGTASAPAGATFNATLAAAGMAASAGATVGATLGVTLAALQLTAAAVVDPLTFDPPPLVRAAGLLYVARRPYVDRLMRRKTT